MKFKIHLIIVLFLTFFSLLLSGSSLAQVSTLTSTSPESLILQLQQQIKALQEQVTKLQAEVSSTKTELETIKTEFEFTKVLRLGIRNDEVKQLQKFLKQKFPDIYTGPITGYFGSLTEAAIRKFQEKQDIESIGVVGPKTLSKLNELFTEGAGASGVVPPGLLTAPGIEKKTEGSISTTTAIVLPPSTSSIGITTPTPTTPISVQPITAVPTGACLVKDRYTDIPRFDIANFGNGFAKYAVSGVNTVSGLQTACTKTIYDYLLQNYCKTSAVPVQRLIATYDYGGIVEPQNIGCSTLGCNFIDCSSIASLATIPPPTTTPSGTIPATPATPATPAQPVSTTSTSTVPAVSATPATPAQPATTTTTADTPPSVTITGPSPGFANSNCTVQLGYTVSDNSGTVIVQEKVNGVNFGSEISNSTVPNGPIIIGGCQNLANGTHTYTVVARDPVGNTTTKSITFSLPLTTTVVAPLAISSLSATNITSNSATITWLTNQPAFSDVRYSTVSNYVYWDKPESVLVTSHSIGLTGLSPSTTYYYWVSSDNSSGSVKAAMQTFVTSAASASGTTPPVISNVRAENITSRDAQIKWTTDIPSDSLIFLNSNSSSGPFYIGSGVGACVGGSEGNVYVTDHCISLYYASLVPSTTYYYKVHSSSSQPDPSKSSSYSSVQQFTTTAAASTATTTTSLDSRVKKLSAISQMINSLDEILKQLSQILK